MHVDTRALQFGRHERPVPPHRPLAAARRVPAGVGCRLPTAARAFAAAGRALAAAVAGLFTVAHTGFAETVPEDPRSDWRVGFTALRGGRLAPENRYLRTAIPRLLRERLAPIREHALSVAEQRRQARRLLAAAQRRARAELAALLRRRDAQVLQGSTTDTLDEQLVEQRGRLAELQALSWAMLDIAPRKPLQLVSSNADEDLFPAPRFSPLEVAEQADLDLLITGRLQEVEGILFVELQAISPGLDGPADTYRDALRRAGLTEAVREMQQHLARLLIGEPWGTIIVTPMPRHGAVHVDGVFVGSGRVELPYQSLGLHTIRVTAPGHEPADRSVTLDGSEVVVELTLAPRRERLVTVASTPPGASLYLDSAWLGVTPLPVPATERTARALLRLDGHHDAALLLNDESAPQAQIDLDAADYDPQTRQGEMRDRFYEQFGAALLSFAGPAVLFSASADADGDPEAGTGQRDLLYGGGIAATVLSGALLVRAVVGLGDYLDAASRRAL